VATTETRPPSRDEESRISVRALVIASAASATAAVVISQFWRQGTLLAAAMTPVIVTVVSELLHRHTARIAERVTIDRTAPLPEAGGPAPPPEEADAAGEERREGGEVPRVAPEPAPRRAASSAVRVFRSPKFRVRLALVTAALAFVIAAAAVTLPELIAGKSLSSGDRDTTLFGGGGGGGEQREEPTQPGVPQPEGGEQVPAPTPEAPGQPELQTEPPPATSPSEDEQPPTDTEATAPEGE
jgi:hypothetical protein